MRRTDHDRFRLTLSTVTTVTHPLRKLINFVAIQKQFKIRSLSFFCIMVTCVTSIHRAYFFIQPYFNDFKRYCVQRSAASQSKECSHDNISNNWPSQVWRIKITGTDSRKQIYPSLAAAVSGP